MIRRSFRAFAVLPASAVALSLATATTPALAQTSGATSISDTEQQRFTANQLDNLVGPIALYPDALLAQVLVAATFPDQIEDAARYVKANGTSGVDEQPWDVSVRAVAHYASAINMMADKIDWTATLGRAYANQSSDIMAAVQRMRALAARQGNLQTTPEQQVSYDDDTYIITPRQSRVIYVPVYDPILVYEQPIFTFGVRSPYWSFGVGFPIGAWLGYDMDWRARNVYYNGWGDAYLEYGGGWRARSRPFIQITNVYYSPRPRPVFINVNVWRRPINWVNVDRWGGYHRDTYFDNHHVVGLAGRNGDTRGGGDYRGGDNRGGDNRGGDNRGRDNRGGDNRGGDNRGGDNRGGDIRGGNNDGYTGRTATPRDRGVMTPDGYRNGDRGGERNGERNTPRDPRPTVAVPEGRRNEPTVRGGEIAAPTPVERRGGRTDERQAAPRNERRNEPRSEPRGEPRMQAPRGEAQRSAPSGDKRSGESRSASPRGGRGN